MDEISIIKDKIKSIISEYQGESFSKEFENLLGELNDLQSNAVILPNDGILSKVFTSIRTKFFKGKSKKEFDEKKYLEIRDRIIKLYCDRVLKKEYPIIVKKVNEGDAYFTDIYGNAPNEKFFEEIRKYQVAHVRMREIESKRIEIYPWSVGEEELASLANVEYLKISETFLTTKENKKEAFEEVTTRLSSKNKLIKEIFMQSEIEPYYGSPDFICERSKYILECMETLLSDKDVKPENKITTEQLINEARKLVEEVDEYTQCLLTQKDKEKYDKIRSNYTKLLEFENVILKDIEQIWNEFLTNPKDYKKGERFAFLAHTSANGIREENKRDKCCCTLVTEKCMPLPYGDIGIICGFNAANIGTMCTEDAGSWIISKEEFFDRRNTYRLAICRKSRK